MTTMVAQRRFSLLFQALADSLLTMSRPTYPSATPRTALITVEEPPNVCTSPNRRFDLVKTANSNQYRSAELRRIHPARRRSSATPPPY